MRDGYLLWFTNLHCTVGSANLCNQLYIDSATDSGDQLRCFEHIKSISNIPGKIFSQSIKVEVGH